jgi:predicted metal-dependent hydrolase
MGSTSTLHENLASRLRRRLRRKLTLVLHDNRKVMLSFRRRNRALTLRLHHMFLSAGNADLAAVARFVNSKDPEARERIERYILRYGHLLGVKLPSSVTPAKGNAYDLERVFRSLNRRFFQNRVRARILWGSRAKRERKRTIRLGYYCDSEKKIVINPALDRRSVPRYVLEWIVFHEMLHQVIGFELINGLLVAHTREFRRREQRFPRYVEASAWESRNLARLLRA